MVAEQAEALLQLAAASAAKGDARAAVMQLYHAAGAFDAAAASMAPFEAEQAAGARRRSAWWLRAVFLRCNRQRFR